MTTRKSSLPTLRMMRELIKAAPGWYLANVFLWTSIWVLPVIPALITLRFFDDLETVGFNPEQRCDQRERALHLGFASYLLCFLGAKGRTANCSESTERPTASSPRGANP